MGYYTLDLAGLGLRGVVSLVLLVEFQTAISPNGCWCSGQ